MNNSPRMLLVVCLVANFLAWGQPASAQYDGNSNNNSNTGNTRRRGAADDSRNTNTNPPDRRRRTVGTSVDEETSEERERRRDEGLEDPAGKGAPPASPMDRESSVKSTRAPGASFRPSSERPRSRS